MCELRFRSSDAFLHQVRDIFGSLEINKNAERRTSNAQRRLDAGEQIAI
jgi:hypothetical protein